MSEETPQLPVSEQEVQIEAPSLLDKIKAQKKKIFIGIGLFLGVLILAGAVFGVYKYTQKQISLEPGEGPTPSLIATPTPNETATWETYTNTEYGFSIEHPDYMVVDEKILDESLSVFFRLKSLDNSELVCNGTHLTINVNTEGLCGSLVYKGTTSKIIETKYLLDKISTTRYDDYFQDKHVETRLSMVSQRKNNYLLDYIITLENYPQLNENHKLFNLMLSTFKFLEEENCVKTDTGESMTLSEAKEIALKSDCVKEGSLKETYFCNNFTGTWWLDLDIEKTGCAPAYVVNVVTKEAEINWRCTGLLPE